MALSALLEKSTNSEPRLNVVRLNSGKPIIEADPNSWDSRFTLNPTALHIGRSPKNDGLIKGLLGEGCLNNPLLKDGVVAIYYRGIPDDQPGLPSCRSSVGLAVFTPKLQLLKRFSYPVLSPTNDPDGYDYNGVEDQRITRIGDTFYLVYCGFLWKPNDRSTVQICMAESTDMLNWKKLGPVAGDVNQWPNKDAVIMSEPVDGRYIMLHRPSKGQQSDFSIHLAVSDSPTGEWMDCGPVMSAVRHPRYVESWVGMGSTPIMVDEGIYVADYHTGNYLPCGERDYFANVAVLNFNKLDLRKPSKIVESRCEGILFPETTYEQNSPWPHPRPLNCVFPCGSYEYKGDIYMIYGGADAYVLAAKVNKNELLDHNELCGNSHSWGCSGLAS